MILAVFLSSVLLASPPQSADCTDVAACRQAALEAASREDFERFHDLAWRAVQKGRPNDPELMRLLARAQSLSGRPGDALVMLRRLAQMGLVTDARESDDFRVVRTLPGWPEVESVIAQTAEAAAGRVASTPASPIVKGAVPRSPKPVPAEHAASNAPAAAATSGAEETVRLTEKAIDPIGLAYDGASRRFVVGDRRANRLLVADEVFKRVNDLLSASSGGFGALGALEIDSRRGDLWVTSSTAESAAIHKLQLVSGRVLFKLDVPADLQPAAFSDVLVTDAGVLMLIDSLGGRLFRVSSDGSRFERPLELHVTAATSLALAGNTAYVAHQDGVSSVDLATGRVSAVRESAGVSLAGLRRLRWHRGALIGIQAGSDGGAHLVRIRLAQNGRVATAVDDLDSSAGTEGTAFTLSRDAVYYIAHTDDGPIIRRVPLH